MFIKEFKVTGNMLEGQIIGNWTNKHPYAFKLEKISKSTYEEGDLDKLITELQAVQAKIKEENNE
ncbi:hypothetical protein [Bacillus cereus]|uniref:hypothetical protein n=1 Tax=Bacillus cereus TaxID=1396 RepID=UPI00192D3418|nr:hypothetical protein [Bacillus cereus]